MQPPLDYPDPIFCKSEDDLLNSLLEFQRFPELHAVAVGKTPLYFVHQVVNGSHLFGLSKFCAFRNITLPAYRGHYRRKRDGGDTQKHIAELMGKPWLPYQHVSLQTQQAFEKWILNFYPSYNVTKASFITIAESNSVPFQPTEYNMTPEELQGKLKRQMEIGKAGEAIAYQYELNRVRKISNSAHVKDIFNTNVCAGFDIESKAGDEHRFIEVKSSTISGRSFFLSSNEYDVLKDFRGDAYIYLVRVDNIDQKLGEVYDIIPDPIGTLPSSWFKTSEYLVSLPSKR